MKTVQFVYKYFNWPLPIDNTIFILNRFIKILMFKLVSDKFTGATCLVGKIIKYVMVLADSKNKDCSKNLHIPNNEQSQEIDGLEHQIIVQLSCIDQCQQLVIDLSAIFQVEKQNARLLDQSAQTQVLVSINRLHQICQIQQLKVKQRYKKKMKKMKKFIDILRDQQVVKEEKHSAEMTKTLEELRRVKEDQQKQFALRQEIIKRKFSPVGSEEILYLINEELRFYRQIMDYMNPQKKENYQFNLLCLKAGINCYSKLINMSFDIVNQKIFDDHHIILPMTNLL